jgi:hypothetical protein
VYVAELGAFSTTNYARKYHNWLHETARLTAARAEVRLGAGGIIESATVGFRWETPARGSCTDVLSTYDAKWDPGTSRQLAVPDEWGEARVTLATRDVREYSPGCAPGTDNPFLVERAQGLHRFTYTDRGELLWCSNAAQVNAATRQTCLQDDWYATLTRRG